MRQAALPAAVLLWAGMCAAQPVGYPSRAPELDVLPGFRNPPAGYGEVAFYWWLGDPLTKERLTWHLNQLQGKGVTALQVNYAHSDQGGRSYGLTYESDPPLLSEKWWELFGWFLKEARARGMAASLSDYTLGWAGNGWYMDQILKEHPEVHGAVLERETRECAGTCEWEMAAEALSVTAFRLEGGRILPGTAVDLRVHVRGRRVQWRAPAGQWRLVAVRVKDVPVSIDPMHALTGRQMIEKFFQPFEDRNPGESGKGLNFFFSDELSSGVRGWLWNGAFAEEFRKRKGYDVTPELASLFEETGPRAVKVRLDYSDVMVSLEEENYFRPIYEWHTARGMLYGCDHGGRGRDVTEFGDYFRTQRWMSGPGNDQPRLGSDLIKNKVASSIAHLYERPRTWLEGYYGSGWGTTSADIVDATWRNFAHGHNLLTLHGLYYSTRGGWWEWAPPDNHFRMPYWAHMGEFLHAVERMSYVLSQGVHRADVAVMYPVAAVEAGRGGKQSVEAAFAVGKSLYAAGIDFDYMDFQSLERARIEGRKLKVAGEEYRALVLPAMRVVRHSTLVKAVEFRRAGGTVVVLGELPRASERQGEGDAEVVALAAELAGDVVKTDGEAIGRMDGDFARDFRCEAASQPSVLHRRAGARDVYFVYGAEKGTECTFRATGKAEVWDPWTGKAAPLGVLRQAEGFTSLGMPLEKTEAQLIVFSPGEAARAEMKVGVPAAVAVLDGEWEFELKPTLDNRYGDYRLPAAPVLLGAEARRLRYRGEGPKKEDWSGLGVDDSKWEESTYTFGPRFWKAGPLPAGAAAPGDGDARWQPYEFSWKWGIENDPGHQGYHGLKGEAPVDFIGLGKREEKATTTVYTAEPGGSVYYLKTSVAAPRAMRARIVAGGELPAAVWINGSAVGAGVKEVVLRQGANRLLLRYDKAGRGHFLLMDAGAAADWKQTAPLASPWFGRPGVLEFDTRAEEARPAGWYRTTAPPGLRGVTFEVRGRALLWVDGRAVRLVSAATAQKGVVRYRAVLERVQARPAKVAIRVEQERGSYAGAAFVEPVEFDCGVGRLEAGDWARVEGLSSYSGGAWYRRDVTLSADQARRRIWLDLGQVSASAEVRVNGKVAGIRLAPPFRVEVTGLMKAGVNRVEVLVYSALSGQYQTVPTRYRGQGPSGLIGPVRVVEEGGR